MNTNFTNRFDVMTADMLLDIEGGKCSSVQANKETLAAMGGTMIVSIPAGPGAMAIGGLLAGAAARVKYYITC